MDESEARDIFKSIAETIQFCHQYSIIHRDIKLENVLLDGTCPMLIDFGLANFYGSALMETFCGSLPYTAPEILRGTAYTGPEVDVWSLGVLLYVMLTGHFPFDDPAQPANFDRIMAGDFPRRSALGHRVLDLLTRMLEPDSAKRIQLPDVLGHMWLADKVPGVCCSRHCSSAHQPTSVHSHRTLALPGPCTSTIVAGEVATILDRPLSYVTDHIDKALAQGKPAETTTSNSCGNLLASIEQWPMSLHSLCQGPLLTVPNSPTVSVYALVLQQIGLRRYFMDLPPLEPQLASTTRSSSSRLESNNSRSLTSRLVAQITKPQNGIRNLNDSSIVPPAYLQPLSTSELALRTISSIDHVHERIVLPNELTANSPLHVLAQLIALLSMHQIAHKFVETQKMPAHLSTLNSSMFSLATLAMSSSTDALAQPKQPLQSHSPAKNNSRLRSLISKFSKAAPANHSTPMLVEQKQRPRIVHPHLRDEYSATVPVKHPTAVMVAQYSPSLHRNRETEVVEYYSCSVRMELVRISNSVINLRPPRYALLIERIAGHRGKFVLFKLFLHRIVAALPDIQPDSGIYR
ncbi:hypothetical protein BX667DRAFT_497767 [Coemansia mojavensis]|nr:hypothetical protein BX667DRAFT_497767 [Coemansia mojavensis]